MLCKEKAWIVDYPNGTSDQFWEFPHDMTDEGVCAIMIIGTGPTGSFVGARVRRDRAWIALVAFGSEIEFCDVPDEILAEIQMDRLVWS